jgi:hypothetical protein
MADNKEEPRPKVIVLAKFSKDQPASRIWTSTQSLGEALQNVCSMYEAQWHAKQTTKQSKISYTMVQVMEFVDRFPDLVFLVDNGNGYDPRDKKWIKTQLFQHTRTEMYAQARDKPKSSS